MNFKWIEGWISWSKQIKKWLTPLSALFLLMAFLVVNGIESSRFESAKLLLGSKIESRKNLTIAVMEAAKMNDLITAREILNWWQLNPLVELDNQAVMSAYPKERVENLQHKWVEYLEVHPMSIPVLIEQASLLWQLGDLATAYQVLENSLKVDPGNQLVVALIEKAGEEKSR